MAQNKWELKHHDKADNPYWEITNGPISMCVNDDDLEHAAQHLEPIVLRLNQCDAPFRSENKLELDQHIEIMQLQDQLRQMEQWKREASELLAPILDYGQGHREAQLGASCTEFVLTRAKQYDELKAENVRLTDEISKAIKRSEKKGQLLIDEQTALKVKAKKLVEALGKIEALADRGIFPGIPVETMGAQMCIEIKKATSEALSSWNEGKEGKL